MEKDIKIPLLSSEDIEVKVKQVTKTGALALLYKTARVDRKILNKVFGIFNWTSDFKIVNDTLFCGIGVREKEDQPFVWKWEAGGESENSLDDGAAAKAETSDAFKRAGFAVGIGEELYSSPQIFLNVATVQKGDKWYLEDKYAKYVVTDIEYNEDTRVITKLEICNAKSNVKVFSWEMPTTGALAKKMSETIVNDSQDLTVAAEEEKLPFTMPEKSSDNIPFDQMISEIGRMVKAIKERDGNTEAYAEIVKQNAPEGFKCNKATVEQYDIVKTIYKEMKKTLGE